MDESPVLLFGGVLAVLLCLLIRSAFVHGHRTAHMPDGMHLVVTNTNLNR